MTPEQLKASILQYAIQGKLVEQRAEEGTAEELYQQIQEEKQKLIKAGKIKKGKSLASITDDEKLFDIPEGWKWVRLGDVYNLIMGQSPNGNSVSESPDGMEFHQGKVFFGTDYIQKSSQTTSAPSKIAEPNSVLLCVRAPVGIVNITDRELCIGRGLCDVVPLGGMDEKFTLFWLRCFKDVFIKKATGTTFVAITGEVVKNQVIPLPPLAEQHRIVAKIEELLPLVDRYAASYEKLEQFNAKFPEDMKKSILQYAIQGKLVEQRPEEGTGEELYQQIQAEKQRLIQEKKIKKEKPLPEIAEDEIPFDIPESWKWCRLSDIIDVRDGTHDSPKYVPEGIPLVTSKNLSNGMIDYGNVKYITQEDADKINARSMVDDDDILFAMIGSIGNPVLVKKDREFCIKNMALFKKFADTDISMQYMYWFFFYAQYKLKKEASGGVQSFISLSRFREYLVPLPPFAEQKRIVAKIEELLPLCERLK